MSTMPHVFIVAGEESGDRLGAALIAALKDAAHDAVRISGIGGAHMAEAGVETPFLLGDLAIMGFAAIPARLPLILRRIREAADAYKVTWTRADWYAVLTASREEPLP